MAKLSIQITDITDISDSDHPTNHNHEILLDKECSCAPNSRTCEWCKGTGYLLTYEGVILKEFIERHITKE